MILGDLREAYYQASEKLSDSVRQLSFAGIAVVWIFRLGIDSGGIAYSKSFTYALGLFVLSLIFDLLQYLYKSIAWSFIHRIKEKKISNTKTFQVSKYINWPSIFFFYLKVAFVVGGYILLLTIIGTEILTEE